MKKADPPAPDPVSPVSCDEAVGNDTDASPEQEQVFRLNVSEDKMRVFLDLDEPPGAIPELAYCVIDRLPELGVVNGPPLERLCRLLLDAVENDPHVVRVIILEGQPVVPPEHGRIEWTDDFFNPDFVVDEATGRIDYRQRAARASVTEGQLLARFIPAKPGEEGCDIFGKKLPPEKASQPRIRAGKNVRHDQAANEFYAAKSGRIRWTDETLTVDDVYTIRGSVGLETGDISHPGAVIVEGDIREGSKIEALGDLEVRGIIEVAHVQCGGNLLAHGGIAGDRNHHVVVGGQVHAKYIIDAQIQAKDTVTVEKEILQSWVKTRGAIRVPRGRIVGGECLALGGIEVWQAGSSAAIPTRLIAAEDYTLDGLLAPKREEIWKLESNRKKIRATVDPIVSGEVKLPPEKQQILETLLSTVQEIELRLQELAVDMEEIRSESRSRARNIILMRNHAFPGVELTIDRICLLIKEDIDGPVQPSFSEDGRKLHLDLM